MSRSPRIDGRGLRHHVYNRSQLETPLFADDNICALFVELLARLPSRYGVEVHGFALVGKHYHLMLRSRRPRLGEAMRYLSGQFARLFNDKIGRKGPVFSGRYHNRVVPDPIYWKHLLAYVHRNPVCAGLAQTVDDARWTSHIYYSGQAMRPEWLSSDELCALYGSLDAYNDYLDDLQRHRVELPVVFDEHRLWSRTLSRPALAIDQVPVEAEQALDEVATVCGVDRGELQVTRRGRHGNPARRLACWWLPLRCELSYMQTGRQLGVSPSCVGKQAYQIRYAGPHEPEILRCKRELLVLLEEQEL